MKVSVKKENLQSALSHVYSITERKSTIPILCNVKIEAGEDLKISGINVDMEIIEKVEADITQTGAITVPAHTFHDVVRKLPAGDVDLEMEKDVMILRAGKSKFKLPTLPVSDFPVMSMDDSTIKFSLSPDDMIKMIDKTKFAISTEETRYFLNGVFIHSLNFEGKDILRAVATDGHRLARQDVAQPEGAAGIEGIIIPRKVVLELRRLLEDTSEDIRFEISETKVRFEFSNISITSKLIDGKFPEYEKIIPQGNDKVVEVDCDKLYDAVDRVSSVSNEKSKAIKMKVVGNVITFFASTTDTSSGVEELDATYNSDETIEIGFNSRYIMDVASQIEGKKMKVVMADNSSPAVVLEHNDNSYLYVIMPMRIV